MHQDLALFPSDPLLMGKPRPEKKRVLPLVSWHLNRRDRTKTPGASEDGETRMRPHIWGKFLHLPRPQFPCV